MQGSLESSLKAIVLTVIASKLVSSSLHQLASAKFHSHISNRFRFLSLMAHIELRVIGLAIAVCDWTLDGRAF